MPGSLEHVFVWEGIRLITPGCDIESARGTRLCDQAAGHPGKERGLKGSEVRAHPTFIPTNTSSGSGAGCFQCRFSSRMRLATFYVLLDAARGDATGSAVVGDIIDAVRNRKARLTDGSR